MEILISQWLIINTQISMISISKSIGIEMLIYFIMSIKTKNMLNKLHQNITFLIIIKTNFIMICFKPWLITCKNNKDNL